MSDRTLDLQRSLRIVKRRKTLVGLVAAVGLLAGAGYSVLRPPLLTSTALVVLPGSVPANATSSGSNVISPYTATQMVIARSTPVLVDALPNVKPSVSLEKLYNEIQVQSLTSYIISIGAKSKLATDAEATANAVANSYVAYVNSASSPIPHVSARILQQATIATGEKPWEAALVKGLIGILAGTVIGIVLSLAVGLKDRRLRERDEIASAIGIPVVGSFPVRHPKDAAGWTGLLQDSEFRAQDAWRMRQALQQLGMEDINLDNGFDGGNFSVAVLSLSSDPGALALGPHLAVFATSLGIPTALVIGPQPDGETSATLRTACGMVTPPTSNRSGSLHVIIGDSGTARTQFGGMMHVVVGVLDSRSPRVPDTMRTTTTVLAVSAGKTTAEQLARAAVAASADGRNVTGILVADPEASDRTTGRIAAGAQPRKHRLPTRLNGIFTEIRR